MHTERKGKVRIEKTLNGSIIGYEELDVNAQCVIENVVVNATGLCYASIKTFRRE